MNTYAAAIQTPPAAPAAQPQTEAPAQAAGATQAAPAAPRKASRSGAKMKKTLAPASVAPRDSAWRTDSLRKDSLARVEPVYGIVVRPEHEIAPAVERTDLPTGASSWVMLALLAILVAVCLKFRNSRHYFAILARDLTDTRKRNNMFDDTVRETSFLFLLNLMCLLSCGAILFFAGVGPAAGVWHPGGDDYAAGAGICMGLTLVYGLFMWVMYHVTGLVFSDSTSTGIWVRGYEAVQALSGAGFFVLALLCLIYPSDCETFGIIALGLVALGKIVFIIKGWRIFLKDYTSLILFFYYLCALEIVPLILLYAGACALCRLAL